MNLKVLIDEQILQKRIEEMAKQIEKDYAGREIVIISILTGAVYFTIDLTKRINNDRLMLEFMKVSSYGNSQESTGEIKITKDIEHSLEGKDIIIVEDIIDTGLTMVTLKNYLLSKKPNSLKICTLLDKKERRKVEIEADYVGFEIPNKFVLGYGLDYEDYYRNLPYIAVNEE